MSRAFCLMLALVIFTLPASARATGGDTEKDRTFIQDALKGDNSEMTLGHLAMKKGESAKVREFGRTLAADHKKAKADAIPVARKLGVKPTDEMMPEAQDEKDKLEKMSGAEFDNEFAGYMVKDHKKDIEDFKDQADKGGNGTAKLARKTLPALKKHLKMAQRICSASKDCTEQ